MSYRSMKWHSAGSSSNRLARSQHSVKQAAGSCWRGVRSHTCSPPHMVAAARACSLLLPNSESLSTAGPMQIAEGESSMSHLWRFHLIVHTVHTAVEAAMLTLTPPDGQISLTPDHVRAPLPPCATYGSGRRARCHIRDAKSDSTRDESGTP